MWCPDWLRMRSCVPLQSHRVENGKGWFSKRSQALVTKRRGRGGWAAKPTCPLHWELTSSRQVDPFQLPSSHPLSCHGLRRIDSPSSCSRPTYPPVALTPYIWSRIWLYQSWLLFHVSSPSSFLLAPALVYKPAQVYLITHTHTHTPVFCPISPFSCCLICCLSFS